MDQKQKFTGDRKAPMRSPTAAAEKKLIEACTPRFPGWIQTHHLTLLTLLWSAGLVFFGWLAQESRHWLWLASLMIFLQWFTDAFDGAIGRYRNTGLKRWGYYMDHMLDYIFMACVFMQYGFLMEPDSRALLFVLTLLYGGFEVNSWLEYGATGQFRITQMGVGPTEIRIAFIVINTVVIFAGVGWLEAALPWVLVVGALMFAWIVWNTSRKIWAIDMEHKQSEGERYIDLGNRP